ncbi:MAG: hypothetical protein ABEN55_12255 [Bradymonadaceae bacterium]
MPTKTETEELTEITWTCAHDGCDVTGGAKANLDDWPSRRRLTKKLKADLKRQGARFSGGEMYCPDHSPRVDNG